MAYYNCLLLDADNTLLDFDTAEQKALNETLTQFGLPTDNDTVSQYIAINHELWAALGRGEIRREALMRERWVRFLAATGQTGDAKALNTRYQDQLATHADLLPGVAEVLAELAEVATLAIISNGSARVQQSRLQNSGLMDYFDGVFISEKLKVEKPNRQFFRQALKELGIEHTSRVLVVGDDPYADIAGGIGAELATCWYNPAGAQPPQGIQPKFTIRDLSDLYDIIMEPEERENVGLTHRKHQF